MKPLVSLVTPIYNAMPYLEEYLICVKEQTWRPLEFIAVDDGSDDGSWECLQQMIPVLRESEITVHAMRRVHEGQAAAVNAALPLITGDYFTWCDADDLMTTDGVERKAEYLQCHREIGMVRSDGIYVDADLNRIISHCAVKKDRFTQNVFHELFWGTTYCYAGCYMIRTSLFFECYSQKQIPLSPEGQNLQLLLPPSSRTECGFLPEVTHYYRRRGNGHSAKGRSYTESLVRIENFSTLRLAILPYCKCDRQYYIEQNREITERDRRLLYSAAVTQARKEMKRK